MNAPLSWLTPLALMMALIPTQTIANPTIAETNPAAQAPLSRSKTPVLLAQYVPPPPPSRGAPGSNRGAASRGCLLVAKKSSDPALNSLIALVPATQGKQGTEVWGYTAVEHPTLWFYIPYESTSIAEMELVLNDDQDNRLAKFPVSVPQEAGIIRVQLPATVALQPGQLYNWFFKVRIKSPACGVTNPTLSGTPNEGPVASDSQTPIYVEGWIQRIPPNPNLTSRLQQASPQQQATLYGENGYWYDTLNAIALEHQANPTNPTITAQWVALLKQANLEKLADQPILK